MNLTQRLLAAGEVVAIAAMFALAGACFLAIAVVLFVMLPVLMPLAYWIGEAGNRPAEVG
jgi:hypothetical protein